MELQLQKLMGCIAAFSQKVVRVQQMQSIVWQGAGDPGAPALQVVMVVCKIAPEVLQNRQVMVALHVQEPFKRRRAMLFHARLTAAQRPGVHGELALHLVV
jgi:uncharacterized protein (DUF39 family)